MYSFTLTQSCKSQPGIQGTPLEQRAKTAERMETCPHHRSQPDQQIRTPTQEQGQLPEGGVRRCFRPETLFPASPVAEPLPARFPGIRSRGHPAKGKAADVSSRALTAVIGNGKRSCDPSGREAARKPAQQPPAQPTW